MRSENRGPWGLTVLVDRILPDVELAISGENSVVDDAEVRDGADGGDDGDGGAGGGGDVTPACGGRNPSATVPPSSARS